MAKDNQRKKKIFGELIYVQVIFRPSSSWLKREMEKDKNQALMYQNIYQKLIFIK